MLQFIDHAALPKNINSRAAICILWHYFVYMPTKDANLRLSRFRTEVQLRPHMIIIAVAQRRQGGLRGTSSDGRRW